MNGAGWFFLLLFLLLLGYGGWVGWKVYNARKTGERLVGWKAYIPFVKTGGSTTNYPTPRSSGPIDWVKDKLETLRNKRSQTGGYEGARGDVEGGAYSGLNESGTGAAGRGRGRGAEDDPWDSRVGGRDEDPYGPGPGGYYEEQELGLAPTPGVGAAGVQHNRNVSDPYANDYINQPTSYGGGRGASRDRDSLGDPFADSHQAPSLRSVSPRPAALDTHAGGSMHRKGDSDEGGNTSPISTRKSVFREDVN